VNTLVVRMLVASIEMKDGNAIVIQVLTKKEMIALTLMSVLFMEVVPVKVPSTHDVKIGLVVIAVYVRMGSEELPRVVKL